MSKFLTEPLTLSSQFPFCGLPLRLDSYAGCALNCKFCFARLRGGYRGAETIRPARKGSLARTFRRALDGPSRVGVVGQFLRRRVPVHFGGMSDPFQPAEEACGATAAFLGTLGEYSYPTVISTRSAAVAEERSLALLRKIRWLVVQFSFSTTRDGVSGRYESRWSPPSALLRSMETLATAGVTVTCRWQPYIPGVSESPGEFVARVGSAGARHVALEHLKVPIERRGRLWQSFSRVIGRDLRAEYLQEGAYRDGREFLLPTALKLPLVTEVAREVRSRNMTFGAADNDLQYLSDTGCCCSGVDQFRGFENWFKHQIGYAVRASRSKERILYSTLAREWAPSGSIDRYLNSHSRLTRRKPDVEGGLRDHIRHKWNSLPAAGGPGQFHGVVATEERTSSGNRVYAWLGSAAGGPLVH